MTDLSETEILDQETDQEQQEQQTDSEEASNVESETEDSTDESESESNEENPEEIPEEEQRVGAPPFNQLRKEFPDVFKKYPGIQANYFKAEKYSEYFPTVEEAESAARKVEIFDTLDQHVTNGDFSPLINLLSSQNPRALARVADEILPNLQQYDKQLYVRAIQPAFKHFIETAYSTASQFANSTDEATKEYGNNLKNATKLITHFLFGPQGIPQDVAPARPAEDPEKQQLIQQQYNLFGTMAMNFQQSTHAEARKELVNLIEKDLDPEGKLTKFTKDKLIETLVQDVNEKIKQDGAVQKQLQSLWIQSGRAGFTDQSKAQLNRAFLGRAKMIIPRLRQLRYSEALGITPPKNGKTSIPQAGGAIKAKSSRISPKEAREKGMSEMDIINFGAK